MGEFPMACFPIQRNEAEPHQAANITTQCCRLRVHFRSFLFYLRNEAVVATLNYDFYFGITVLFVPAMQATNITTIQNGDNGVVPWFPSPVTRGTLNILSDCTFTLLLCISTVLHLNVPAHGETKWGTFWRKSKWVLCGLIAPEIVLYVAFEQWRKAKWLQSQINSSLAIADESNLNSRTGRKRGSDEEDVLGSEAVEMLEREALQEPATLNKQDIENEERGCQEWSLPQCFFVVMGGIAFDASHLSTKHKRLTLTVPGMVFLIKLGRIPKVSQELVADKSKADFLAKILVILQAGWLVIQCICRKIEDLDISLLEVHTMVHVCCALLMYFFWFRKPLDITDPLLVKSDAFDECLAYMMMISRGSDLETGHRPRFSPFGGNEASILEYKPEYINRLSTVTDRSDNTSRERQGDAASRLNKDSRSDRPSAMFIGDSHNRQHRRDYRLVKVPREYMKREKASFAMGFTEIDNQSGFGPSNVIRRFDHDNTYVINHQDATRWQLAARLLHKEPSLAAFGCLGAPPTKTANGVETIYAYDDRRLLTRTAANLQETLTNPEQAQPGTDLLVFFLLSSCYGAIHASAYTFVFPSTFESAAWYCSSLFIASASYLIFAVWSTWMAAVNCDEMIRWAEFAKLPWFLLRCLCAVILACYGLARIFLVVEAFISLRSMPVSVYRVVEWTRYIPHF